MFSHQAVTVHGEIVATSEKASSANRPLRYVRV